MSTDAQANDNSEWNIAFSDWWRRKLFMSSKRRIKIKIITRRFFACLRLINYFKSKSYTTSLVTQLKSGRRKWSDEEENSDEHNPSPRLYSLNISFSQQKVFVLINEIILEYLLLRAAKGIFMMKNQIIMMTLLICAIFHVIQLSCDQRWSNCRRENLKGGKVEFPFCNFEPLIKFIIRSFCKLQRQMWRGWIECFTIAFVQILLQSKPTSVVLGLESD